MPSDIPAALLKAVRPSLASACEVAQLGFLVYNTVTCLVLLIVLKI